MGKGMRNKNKRRKKEIYNFLIDGLTNICPDMKKMLEQLSKAIYSEFGSKKAYINYYQAIEMIDLIKCEQENEDFFQKYKFGFLMTNKKTFEFKEKSTFYRIMNENIEWYDSRGKLYSNPHSTIDMRFNLAGERMLYITTCKNIGIKEAKVFGPSTFTEIEYRSIQKLKIAKLGYENISKVDMNQTGYKFTGMILGNLIGHSADNDELVYKVTNRLKKFYLENDGNIDGYMYTSKYLCNRNDCLRDSTGIKNTSEKKLMPVAISQFDMNENNLFKLEMKKQIELDGENIKLITEIDEEVIDAED